MNSCGLFRHPFATGASAPGGLFFGEHYGAVRFALFAELHSDSVRGIHFEEMVDAAGERRAEEAMAQELRYENVRGALDVISGVRVALDAHTELAHFLNPAPDLLARDADFLGDF